MKLLALILFAACLSAAEIDAKRLALITERMQGFVSKGEISGAVTLVEHKGKVVHLSAVGMSNLKTKEPMATDTIFEVMSMTKPFTGVAIMMLVEEGRVTISDPVEKYLPEFRGQLLQAGATLGPPSRKITIHDLMTHTSGMPEYGPEPLKNIYYTMDIPLEKAVLYYSQMPLLFEPGTKWQYSNTGLASLGRIVEVVSGMPYEKFVEERIFKPLGMKDSFFFPTPDRYARIAHVYGPGAAGSQTDLGDGIYRKGAKYSMPEGGMYSTASDLVRFYRMMLNGGTFNGKRLISKVAVDTMTELHTAAIDPSGHGPGMGYGLTWAIAKDARATTNLQSLGTFGHGGAFGTDAFLDPKRDLIGILLIQRFPNASGAETRILRSLATAAITE